MGWPGGSTHARGMQASLREPCHALANPLSAQRSGPHSGQPETRPSQLSLIHISEPTRLALI
eukprot:9519223-Alexandrium_andersonii.AAC.1